MLSPARRGPRALIGITICRGAVGVVWTPLGSRGDAQVPVSRASEVPTAPHDVAFLVWRAELLRRSGSKEAVAPARNDALQGEAPLFHHVVVANRLVLGAWIN